MDKAKIHAEICEKLNQIYQAKNHDYGDSFAIVRGKVNNAILVRLWDKLLRVTQLLQSNEQKVADEKVEDTLLDLANYCILELIEQEIEKGKHDD